MQKIPEVHVVAAIFVDKDCLLAFRRAPHKVSAGFWEFPGGKVEAGESEIEALRREVLEELKIELGPVDFLNTAITQIGKQRIRLSCYTSQQQFFAVPVSTDHDLVIWVKKDAALELDWAKPDLPALELLIRKGIL